MKISEIIARKSIIHHLSARDKKGVIKELVQTVSTICKADKLNAADIVETIMNREKVGSTGIGGGIAVPHAKCQIKRVIAAVGRSSQGIDYGAVDGEPVYLVFLLLSPAAEAESHLHALKKIMETIRRPNVCKFMRNSKNAKDMEDILREAEEGIQVS